jgi:hypothetical protein
MAHAVGLLIIGLVWLVVWLVAWGVSVRRGKRRTDEFRDAIKTGDWPSDTRRSPLSNPLYKAFPPDEWLTCKEICNRIPRSVTGGRGQIKQRMDYLVAKRFAERRLPPVRKFLRFPYLPQSAIRYRKVELIGTTFAAEGGATQKRSQAPPTRKGLVQWYRNLPVSPSPWKDPR